MKITKEILKRMIKEELKEAYRDQYGQPQHVSNRYPVKKRSVPRMDLQTAMAFLKFGWDGLEDDQRERIEALQQSLLASSQNFKNPQFKQQAEEKYNTLTAAIENSKGEQ